MSLHHSYTFWQSPHVEFHWFHCASTQAAHRTVSLQWFWRGRRHSFEMWLSRPCRCREVGLR